jgi:hypothetical protein
LQTKKRGSVNPEQPHVHRIRHEDEKKPSAISMRILQNGGGGIAIRRAPWEPTIANVELVTTPGRPSPTRLRPCDDPTKTAKWLTGYTCRDTGNPRYSILPVEMQRRLTNGTPLFGSTGRRGGFHRP